MEVVKRVGMIARSWVHGKYQFFTFTPHPPNLTLYDLPIPSTLGFLPATRHPPPATIPQVLGLTYPMLYLGAIRTA